MINKYEYLCIIYNNIYIIYYKINNSKYGVSQAIRIGSKTAIPLILKLKNLREQTSYNSRTKERNQQKRL